MLHQTVQKVTAPQRTVCEWVNESSFARCTPGRDLGSSLPALLTALVAVLPADGRTFLRVGMTNPVRSSWLDRLALLASNFLLNLLRPRTVLEMFRPSLWFMKMHVVVSNRSPSYWSIWRGLQSISTIPVYSAFCTSLCSRAATGEVVVCTDCILWSQQRTPGTSGTLRVVTTKHG